MNEKSVTEVLTVELTKLLMPLKRLNSVARVKGLLYEVGVDLTAISDTNPDIQTLVNNLAPLVNITEELVVVVARLIEAETEDQEAEAITSLALLVPDVVETVYNVAPTLETSITNALPDILNEIADLAEVLPQRIVEYLLYSYLENYYRRVYSVLHLLGILETEQFAGESYAIKTIKWERFPLVVSDPMELAKQVYGWNAGPDTFLGNRFLSRVEILLRAFILHGGIYRQDDAIRAQFGRVLPDDDRELRIPLYQTGVWSSDPGESTHVELDLNISPIPSDGAKKSGLALYPYVTAGLNFQQELAENWILSIKGNLDPGEVGFGVKLRAPHDLELIDGIFSASPIDSALQYFDARFELGVRRTSPPNSLSYIFGTETGSHLALREAGAKFVVALQEDLEEILGEADFQELTLAINPAVDGDGFIQKLLSGINIKVTSDLLFGVSNLDGFYFGGSGSLEITIPIHEMLGPIKVEAFYISLLVSDGFEVKLAASLGAELGPISASVDRIGLRIPTEIRSSGAGNLGPIDVKSPLFSPPSGAGLSLDAGGIVGGGFLDFDTDNERYSGILGLTFGEIGLTAIGLITTRLPGDKKGFSLLVNIGVIFDPPIELFSGFTLTGVGGIIGVNRSMDIEVLQRGIKNRTLDSILFPNPATVVANAAKIISDMRAVFPPTDGQFVIGPMIKIGWGYPNIITADIGIFIELPDPIRIVLMGQLEAVLPEERKPLVVIHLDVLGVLDFEKEQLTFQASLYDSEILKLKISGDSAFLFGWGNDPRFALSLGGFHPDFTPPPPPIVFADLKRLTIDISSGRDFQLSCRAYQALTPNSFQFGARVDLYASAAGAEVTGYLGFEALIYFSPFSFEVWIGAGVKIKYKGATLADVELSLTLSGPTPWNARGTATIKILFIDIDVGFEITWGRRNKARIPAEDPWPRLREALSANRNWGRALPRGRKMAEILREAEAEATEDSNKILIHPASRFEVRQNVVPLNTRLEKAGNAPVKRYDRFRITRATVNGQEVDLATVKDHFSRGQFESLTNEQKLSLPSFEKMPAGISSAGLGRIRVDGAVEKKLLKFESIIIKDDRTAERQDTSGTFDWEEARPLAAFVARKRSLKRAGPRAQFAAPHLKPKVGLREEAYCIVNAADLTLAGEPGLGDGDEPLTRMSADRALRDHLERSPADAGRYIVVPDYEVAA